MAGIGLFAYDISTLSPTGPGFWIEKWRVDGDMSEHRGMQLVQAVPHLADAGLSLVPGTPQWTEAMNEVRTQGTWDAHAGLNLASGVIDWETFVDDPARWAGQFAPDVLITAFTAGGGAITRIGSTGTRLANGSRRFLTSVSQNGLRTTTGVVRRVTVFRTATTRAATLGVRWQDGIARFGRQHGNLGTRTNGTRSDTGDIVDPDIDGWFFDANGRLRLPNGQFAPTRTDIPNADAPNIDAPVSPNRANTTADNPRPNADADLDVNAAPPIPVVTRVSDNVVTTSRGVNDRTITYDPTTGRPINETGIIRADYGSSTRGDNATDIGRTGNEGDHGGHIGAHRFHGDAPDEGIVPQAANLNLSAWTKMENEWADWTSLGLEVEYSTNVFPPGATRPDEFSVDYTVRDPETGRIVYRNDDTFFNEAGEEFERLFRDDMEIEIAGTTGG